MLDFDAIAALPIFENTLTAWSLALIMLIGVFVVLLLTRRLVHRYHRKFKESGRFGFLHIPLEVLGRTTLAFFIVIAVFASLQMLTLGVVGQRLVPSIVTIAFFWQAGIWLGAMATAWLEHRRRLRLAVDPAALGSLSIIGFVINTLIWAFVVLLTLDNLGIDITALVAGLGIGGVAVALAVQSIFSDVFASLSITLDRPFVVGDFLVVGDVLGTVETIGIKTTRLRSLTGEQIIMPNADLLGSRVRNYGRMMERRVLFTTAVTYDTKLEMLERIPGVIREIVEAQNHTRFDRSHFAKHGTASLEFETVYYVRSADYNRFMDIQQAVNLRLHREFARLGIEFAYSSGKLLMPQKAERAA
jgi:small-conductance mechanosensitive channel